MPPTAPAVPSPAEAIPSHFGPFRILGILGRGGMGIVFDAATPNGHRIALKLIRPLGGGERGDQLLARFRREAEILGRLDHPSIVRLVDHGDIDGLMYLAMERVNGVSLLAVRRQAPLDFDAVSTLGARLAGALAHMHDHGVVHRDIKPANILIEPSGRPVITDFGISGADASSTITQHGDVLGSPGFMAPEVTFGEPPTGASDQFALGRLLYELAALGPAARIPQGLPLREMLRACLHIEWSRMPASHRWPELTSVLQRMTAHDPRDRFPDSHAVEAAFRGLQDGGILDLDTVVGQIAELEPAHAWAEEGTVLMDAVRPSAAELRAAAARVLTGDQPAVDPLLLELDRPVGERLAARGPSFPAPAPLPIALEEEPLDLGTPLPEDPPPAPEPPPDRLPPPSVTDFEPEMTENGDMRPSPRAPSVIRELRLDAPIDRAAPGRPLADILDEREHRPADPANRAPATSPTEGGGDAQAVTRPSSSAETRVPSSVRELALSREVEQLQAALAESQRRGPAIPLVGAIALALLALVGGAAIGHVAASPEIPVPNVVLVPGPARAAELTASFKGGAAGPSPADLRDAKSMLSSADDHLAKRDLERARDFLKLCIEIADLPECHKRMASLLSLTRDPAARTHLEHYLRIAPSAPDAERIRAALEGKLDG